MVVAQVVRVQNNTLRTFFLQSGDLFGAAQIDNRPCDGRIEVHPGFDQVAQGLCVPWERMTSSGLVISEQREDAEDTAEGTDSPAPILRCVVGPVDEDAEGRDWLRFHEESWEPIAKERWLPLGSRHLLGAIGNAVELQITFRDGRVGGSTRRSSRSSGQGVAAAASADLAEVAHFERAVSCAPLNAVFLNVFDLASALSIPNAILCNSTMNTIGAFHAAVEVYGEEWSFYRTPRRETCGVCKSLRPRHHPVHVYRQSVNLGTTTLRDWEVRYLIRSKLAPSWLGGSYDLLHRNCIHFCDELCLGLGVQPVPPWVRGLHETGAAVSGATSTVLHPLALLLGAGDDAHATHGPALEDREVDPGAEGSDLRRSTPLADSGGTAEQAAGTPA